MNKCTVFLTENYAENGVYANLLESSEQTNFPSENAMGKIRRSKVWRSNGYYKIVLGSDSIVFRETVGVDLTATLTAGEYTSSTLFMAEVKRALEAAGDSTYTVTQNSYNKFVIASDGLGGGGIFQLYFGTSTAMAGILGFDTTTLTGALSYTADFLRIMTEEFLTIDLGVPSYIKAFALTGHRNRALKLSSTGTYKIQGNITNAWTSPSFSSTLTYDDEVLCTISSSNLNSTPCRYFRVSISDQNANGYVEVGSIFIGQTYETTRGSPQFPFKGIQNDRSSVVFTEGGQSFSDIQEKSQKINADFVGVTKTELEEMLSIWNEYGKSYPFFMSFDSNVAFSSAINRFVKFVKFDDEPSYQLVSFNNFNVNMTFREDL